MDGDLPCQCTLFLKSCTGELQRGNTKGLRDAHNGELGGGGFAGRVEDGAVLQGAASLAAAEGKDKGGENETGSVGGGASASAGGGSGPDDDTDGSGLNHDFLVRATLSIGNVSRTFQGDIRNMLGKRKFTSLNNCGRPRNSNSCVISVEVHECIDRTLKVRTLRKYTRPESTSKLMLVKN